MICTVAVSVPMGTIHVWPNACTTEATLASLVETDTVGAVSWKPPHAQWPHASGLPQVQGS